MSEMSNTDQALSRAYELIEQERQAEAIAILKPLLTDDANNPGVWWLYAHAVGDPETARAAIDTVLRLDADYPGASDLKQSLEELLPAAKVPGITRLAMPAATPPMPELPELSGQRPMAASAAARPGAFDEEELPDFGVGTPAPDLKRSGSKMPMLLGLAVIAVILIVGAILFLGQPPTPQTASTSTPSLSVAQDTTPTDLPAVATEEETEAAPTERPSTATEEAAATEVEPSEAPAVETETSEPDATAEADSSVGIGSEGGAESDTLIAAFADFTLDAEPTERSQTDLGETLLVRVCGSLAGSSLRATLMEGMTAIASESANLNDDVEALGIRIVDCEGNGQSRAFAVAMDAARDFAQGDLDAVAFQGGWRPVA